MSSSDEHVAALVASCTWLVQKGYRNLALLMRDEFCVTYGTSTAQWNAIVEDLAAFHRSLAEPTDINAEQIEAVRFA